MEGTDLKDTVAPDGASGSPRSEPAGGPLPAPARGLPILLLLWGGLLLLVPRPSEGFLRGDSLVYAAIMKEAARTGEWLSLEFAGQPYFHKPPLLFALGAAAFKVFGASNFTARLFGVLPSLGLLLSVYALGLRLLDGTRAFLAALITLTTYVFLRNGGVPRMDTPLTLVIVLSILVVLEGERRPHLLPLFWVLVGTGVLLKGPAGLQPVGIAGAWSLLSRRRHPWTSGWFWAGLPALPLLVAPWLLENLHRHGDAFVHGYFVDDLARTIGGGEEKSGPFRKYGVDFIEEWWPWLPFIVHGTWIAFREALRGKREGPWPLVAGWIAVVLVAVFSIRTAYSRYLIPLLPATSLAAAHSLVTCFPRVSWNRAPRWILGAATAGSAFLAFWPGSLRAAEIPDIVRYAPVMAAHRSCDPPLYLGRNIPRDEQAAAIFYLDRVLRTTDEEELRNLVLDGRGRMVLAYHGRKAWPEGMRCRVVDRGEDMDLVEVDLPGNFGEGPK